MCATGSKCPQAFFSAGNALFFCRKLLMVKSGSNQPVLWKQCIYTHTDTHRWMGSVQITCLLGSIIYFPNTWYILIFQIRVIKRTWKTHLYTQQCSTYKPTTPFIPIYLLILLNMPYTFIFSCYVPHILVGVGKL
jgi:hypothetical protein